MLHLVSVKKRESTLTWSIKLVPVSFDEPILCGTRNSFETSLLLYSYIFVGVRYANLFLEYPMPQIVLLPCVTKLSVTDYCYCCQASITSNNPVWKTIGTFTNYCQRQKQWYTEISVIYINNAKILNSW